MPTLPAQRHWIWHNDSFSSMRTGLPAKRFSLANDRHGTCPTPARFAGTGRISNYARTLGSCGNGPIRRFRSPQGRLSADGIHPSRAERLHALAGGIPLRIKQLADLALLAGAGLDLRHIDADTVTEACHELGVIVPTS